MNIDNMTYEELIDLNHRIVERLKMHDQIRAHSEMMAFRIGERVRFTPSGRGTLLGTLVKYNKKTVGIVTDEGERWNVAPSLVQKEQQQSTRALGENNIIDIDEGRRAQP